MFKITSFNITNPLGLVTHVRMKDMLIDLLYLLCMTFGQTIYWLDNVNGPFTWKVLQMIALKYTIDTVSTNTTWLAWRDEHIYRRCYWARPLCNVWHNLYFSANIHNINDDELSDYVPPPSWGVMWQIKLVWTFKWDQTSIDPVFV